jgi:hypothetical protein
MTMERTVFVTEGWGRGMRGTVRGSNFILPSSPHHFNVRTSKPLEVD